MRSQIRTKMILGEAAIKKLNETHVAIVGLGGVGSYAAEAIARSGVGEITLVDHDTVDESNINRQLCALYSTIGQNKTEIIAERIKDISPNEKINILTMFYTADTRENLFSLKPDYIIDAIDSVSSKIDLICSAIERDVPIISALGTGNKLDPSQLVIGDIYDTSNCPLARVVRRELRKRGIKKHKVIYSTETPIIPKCESDMKKSTPGSVAWVPGSAGLMMAGYVIRELTSAQVYR